jgi:hypothetical protein
VAFEGGESANTVRSYAGALRYWAAWFRLRYRTALALPVPVPAVLQFLVDHVERTGRADGSPADGVLVHGPVRQARSVRQHRWAGLAVGESLLLKRAVLGRLTSGLLLR